MTKAIFSKVVGSGLLRRVSGLLVARALMLVALLGFNFFILKFFNVVEIGRYYLIATVAYLGNALVFVGADIYLQKVIAPDLQQAWLNRSSFVKYCMACALAGAVPVALFSWLVFSYFGPEHNASIGICVALTVTAFLTTLVKNLYQTGGKPYWSTLIQLVDIVIKLIALIICWYADQPLAQSLFVVYLLLLVPLLLAGYTHFVFSSNSWKQTSYYSGWRAMAAVVFPVGGAGVLNWLQLQVYRPFISTVHGNLAAVGAIAFLTNLGSTATNAVLTVVSQLWLPKVYASKGEVTRLYLKTIAAVGLFLALCSVPAGWLFLSLAGKPELIAGIYLVPVGVLQEVINAMIGALVVHYSVREVHLFIFPLMTSIGVAVMVFALLFYDQLQLPVMPSVAVGLALSQLLVIVGILYFGHKRRLLSYA